MTFEVAILCFHWSDRTMAIYSDRHYQVLVGCGLSWFLRASW